MPQLLALLAAVVPSPPATGGAPPPLAPLDLATVWDLAVKGGVVMIPIALCSLVAVALIIERALVLRRARVIPPGFLDGAATALGEGPGRTLEYCRQHPSAIARIFDAALRRWDRPIDQIEKHVAEAGLREAALLRRRLRGLAVIVAVAPLLGLLGTIFGMIKAFRTVAASAEALGRTEMLAAGIYEAMVTTAAGLLVAIPTLLAFHALASRIDRLVLDMDTACLDLVERHGTSSLRSSRSAA